MSLKRRGLPQGGLVIGLVLLCIMAQLSGWRSTDGVLFWQLSTQPQIAANSWRVTTARRRRRAAVTRGHAASSSPKFKTMQQSFSPLARPGLLHYCPHVMASNFPLLGGLAPGSACPCALHRNDPTVWPRLEYNSVILTFFHRSAVLGIMTSFLIS